MKNIKLNLLTSPLANAKLAKSEAEGYWSYSLSLAPHKLSGRNVCSSASVGCSDSCVAYAGRGSMSNVIAARVRKTKMFFEERQLFLDILKYDIAMAKSHAKANGMIPCFRLNAFSDIAWERFGIMGEFDDCSFYDYSKHIKRMRKYLDKELPANYHLTFSRSESNDEHVDEVVKAGGNVAVVFSELPDRWQGVEVVDGDKNDLRFLDPEPCIVGLAVKGRGKKDKTGFVKWIDKIK